MPVSDDALIRLSGWPAGINNVARELDMPRGEAGQPLTLREATNVDLSDTGKPRRREGYTLAHAGTLGHSGWSDDHFPFALFVDETSMYVMFADESVQAVTTGLARGLPLSFARVNDSVLWTNGIQSGQVGHDLTAHPWCAGSPSGQPTLAAGLGGQLDAGSYQVAVTWFDPLGRESGAVRAEPVDVLAGGAITLTSIPQPPSGWRIRVYCSNGNDGVLKAALTLDAGTLSATIDTRPEGRACDTLLLQPMPPGQIVAHGNGRQFVARGAHVLFSPPFRYGLFEPRYNVVSFNGRVEQMVFVGDGTDAAGLYVADSERTYWLAAPNPKDWRQVIAYPYGAMSGPLGWVIGTKFGLETTARVPVWIARNGRVCIGLPGGQIYQPQPRQGTNDVVFDSADQAAVLFRDDTDTVVAALKNPSAGRFAIRDQLTVREYPRYTD